MTERLRAAMQAALEALENLHGAELRSGLKVRTEPTAKQLRAALAEPEAEPETFDHSIGADRFRVVRGAFWWHVLIGDSPTEHGKFRSRAGAEKMAADLLREFRNGAFVQYKAALADAEGEAWEVDYEVRVDTGYEEMWVAGASSLKDALHYAPQYTDEGTVRVYERRMKVIATMEARHD